MQRRELYQRIGFFTACLFLPAGAARAGLGESPYVGNWAFTIPGGGAGWLGVTQNATDLKLAASILWGGGSVLPVDTINVEDDKLVIERFHGKDKDRFTERITAMLHGDDNLKLTWNKLDAAGRTVNIAEFTGKRTPPLPPAPDFTKVKLGAPIVLFNGKDLDGWELTDPHAANGWSVKDGVLTNGVVQTPGVPHKNFGNLRTVKEFEDFNLTVETNVPKDGNSGVYLRGIYEVQVLDSFGKPLDPHNIGALYSRICPTESAEKPAGEWQTLDISLVDRHVTVILNGKKIIDNKAVLGCTGGALWSDPLRPGPIYLQGDHTSANFRNLVLRPVVK